MDFDAEDLVRRTRDCTRLAAILKAAGESERRWLGREIANLLSILPDAQADLAAHDATLPHVEELVSRVAMLEAVMLELSRDFSASKI